MPTSRNNWREVFRGGTPEAERLHFEKLAADILEIQTRVKERSGAANIGRAFHEKAIVATANAEFRFVAEMPSEFQVGFAAPAAVYAGIVRISNASGAHQSDKEHDLRGIALRLRVSSQEYHDLLMTNVRFSHARNAHQFVAFALAMAGSRILVIPRLVRSLGPFEAIRMLSHVLKARRRPVRSVALESYWSRGAILWGDAGPVRYFLRPAAGTQPADQPAYEDRNYLRSEIGHRLLNDDVVFDFYIQQFADEAKTPIENAATEWKESDSAPVRIGQLTLPKQNIYTTEATEIAHAIDALSFNPWHTTNEFRPLGNINRARKAAYQASSAHRQNLRFNTTIPFRNKFSTALFNVFFAWINRYLPWHRMPSLSLQLLNLLLLRQVLRRKNLIDTDPQPAPPQVQPTPTAPIPEEVRLQRTFDGSYNDLSAPNMGRVGAAFGRNLAPQYRPNILSTPNPVSVSQELFYREHFIPASSLNVIAAAWIQFQVHDWVQHARYALHQAEISIEMPGGMKWRNTAEGPEETVMRIAQNRLLYEAVPGSATPPLTFGDTVSHWWDGSEVYGITAGKARLLRDGAKLRLDNGHLPEDLEGREITGFNESWWLGLSMMHTLFAREHNAVCDALKSAYRNWNEERIYQTAKLIVSALIAKVHTIEWTPAILATEAIDAALNANWFGAPKDWLARLGVWLTDVHSFKGIPETRPDHHGTPYSLTEDFITVYRMHPLLPDEYRICHHRTGELLGAYNFNDIQGKATDEIMRKRRLENVLYSFGISHPGAIALHNYPRALQAFERENGERIDLSVVDLIRDRDRGIPRYNAFRAGLHKPRIRRWEDITENQESVRRLKDIYADIDMIDTMVGLHAETPPQGFGFSDTAFRIFILMATRRLQSDRFLTVDFRPEVYSPLGIDWVNNNSMTSVILRHCPELAAFLPRTRSAFAPWRALPEHQE